MTSNSRRFGNRPGKRRENVRDERERVLLVLGGVTTEKEYFAAVKKALRATGLRVESVEEGWNPAKLLDEAIRRKKADSKQAKADGAASDVYKHVWVVIDVDETATEIKNIRDRARTNGVNLVVSNPCFEVWAVLHVEDYSRPSSRGEVQHRAKENGSIDRENGKSIVWEKFGGVFTLAERRAIALRKRHQTAGTAFPDDTPSTEVDLIVRVLLDAAIASSPRSQFDL